MSARLASLPGPRRPGIALLTALVVVLLLTTFLSELFFSTGIELRSLQSFKDSTQARRLARSVLKAALIDLQQDETVFFQGYRQLQQLLTITSIDLESGRLVTLDIAPQDSLYNLNDLAGLQQGKNADLVRFEVFHTLMAQIVIPNDDPTLPGTAVPEDQVSALYASLEDWLDADDIPGQAPDGRPGAESAEYFSREPQYTPKDAPLDRLEELRIMRGFSDLHVPWKEVQKRFAVRPKSTKSGELYSEKLNANVASRQEIVDFLTARRVANLPSITDSQLRADQEKVNQYADQADAVAAALVPDSVATDPFSRPTYANDGAIAKALNAAGLNGNAAKIVFTAYSQVYRITVVTEVDRIQATLNAVVSVPRKADRTGQGATILQYSID